MSLIYAVFTISNFIAAPIVGTLNARWGLVFGASCYAVFMVGFLFVNEVYLLTTSCILGVGAAGRSVHIRLGVF